MITDEKAKEDSKAAPTGQIADHAVHDWRLMVGASETNEGAEPLSPKVS